ncbi:MAG: hypothetical protein IKK27_09400 [Alistipes sp.]|nr:hypothetical protein [Alistipes sp.]
MLEDFVKWLALLPEEERNQKIDTVINLFAPNPSREDFKRLKGALKRKENRVKQLEAEIQRVQKPSLDTLFESICHAPDYPELRKRIVAAQLYRNLSMQNKALIKKNNELESEIYRLISNNKE